MRKVKRITSKVAKSSQHFPLTVRGLIRGPKRFASVLNQHQFVLRHEILQVFHANGVPQHMDCHDSFHTGSHCFLQCLLRHVEGDRVCVHKHGLQAALDQGEDTCRPCYCRYKNLVTSITVFAAELIDNGRDGQQVRGASTIHHNCIWAAHCFSKKLLGPFHIFSKRKPSSQEHLGH